VAADGDHAKVFAVVDNLVKGAAGQAIQAMNLMFGLEESAGLRLSGVFP
jgi:N-acetyl-gamma-glutamyl-phosphate reductase